MDTIKLRKISIIADFAHFKIPYSSKNQLTYKIPPISTVIGILKILFNEDIDNFIFGYTFESDEEIFRDLQSITKEVNIKNMSLTNSKRFIKEPCEIQYLVNPKLTIYSDIKGEIEINQCLNLGKTDCLARVLANDIHDIELIDKLGIGVNQWTDAETGNGVIKRITTETVYNEKKGCYDIYSRLVRENKEFEYSKYYDPEDEENIFLWKYKKAGEINVK